MTNQPADAGTPKTAEDYMQQAWYQHARDKEYASAEQNFRKALAMNPRLVDALYGLGLTLKALGRPQESIQEFQKVVDLVDSGVLEDATRSAIVRRLSIGHINRLRTGNWDLEKELWQRKA